MKAARSKKSTVSSEDMPSFTPAVTREKKRWEEGAGPDLESGCWTGRRQSFSREASGEQIIYNMSL